MREIVLGMKPNPKQAEFFNSRARHTAYGGAKAGGKSWAMRTKLIMLALTYPDLNILLLRRTLRELRENHTVPMLRLLHGVAKFNKTEGVFEFPTGSRIVCGYCDSEDDAARYQGHEYDVMGFEEATQFSERMYRSLILCNRTSKPGFAPRAYYTCNPGGIGHDWVKRLFIDRKYRRGELAEDYAFIPASVYDNYVMLRVQPDYVRMLEALPDDLRRAMLHGDWNAFSGMFFPEWDANIHVVSPFPIPDDWLKYRAIDYGLDCAACVWAAFDPEGNCYIYRDFAQKELIISDAARAMLDATPHEEEITATFAPSDIWGRSRDTGITQAELFARCGLLLTFVRNGRMEGWMTVKEWMKVEEACVKDLDGVSLEEGKETPVQLCVPKRKSRLKVFSTCSELIRCLPLLRFDPRRAGDAATTPHDITHITDALRYLLDGCTRAADANRASTAAEFAYDDEPLEYDAQLTGFLHYGG